MRLKDRLPQRPIKSGAWHLNQGSRLGMPIKLHQEFWRTAVGLLLGCAGLALLTWMGVASDFSHPATVALLYMTVIVLVAIMGNIATGIGLAIIATFCLNYFSPNRASVRN